MSQIAQTKRPFKSCTFFVFKTQGSRLRVFVHMHGWGRGLQEKGGIKKPLPRIAEGVFSKKIRQRPTLPHSRPCSTIGAGELNFRVRNGNGWDLSAMATEKSKNKLSVGSYQSSVLNSPAKGRLILNCKLHTADCKLNNQTAG